MEITYKFILLLLVSNAFQFVVSSECHLIFKLLYHANKLVFSERHNMQGAETKNFLESSMILGKDSVCLFVARYFRSHISKSATVITRSEALLTWK